MVDKKDIQAMGDIMSRLNNVFTEDAFNNVPPPAQGTDDINRTVPRAAATVDDGQKKAMGDILRRFRSATDNVRENAMENEALFEALQTEATPKGIRVAEWEVHVTDHPQGLGKYYDVIRDDIVIASDLRLYDAAKRLMEELNNGQSITHPTVRKLLALEAKYSSKLDEAIMYAKKAKNAKGREADIARARLDEAKLAATQARNGILKL